MIKSFQWKNINNEKMYPHPYYPIGSIYLSVNVINPSKWFGGKWELIAQGRTLVGVDTNDTDFSEVKKTGGSKYLQKHDHHVAGRWGSSEHPPTPDGNLQVVNTNGEGWWAGYTDYAGTGDSGNLQPYFTCYIWCRTA